MPFWKMMVLIAGSIIDGTDVWAPSGLQFPSELACQSGIEDVDTFGENPLKCVFWGTAS